jgi:hypothetical protein
MHNITRKTQEYTIDLLHYRLRSHHPRLSSPATGWTPRDSTPKRTGSLMLPDGPPVFVLSFSIGATSTLAWTSGCTVHPTASRAPNWKGTSCRRDTRGPLRRGLPPAPESPVSPIPAMSRCQTVSCGTRPRARATKPPEPARVRCARPVRAPLLITERRQSMADATSAAVSPMGELPVRHHRPGHPHGP